MIMLSYLQVYQKVNKQLKVNIQDNDHDHALVPEDPLVDQHHDQDHHRHAVGEGVARDRVPVHLDLPADGYLTSRVWWIWFRIRVCKSFETIKFGHICQCHYGDIFTSEPIGRSESTDHIRPCNDLEIVALEAR